MGIKKISHIVLGSIAAIDLLYMFGMAVSDVASRVKMQGKNAHTDLDEYDYGDNDAFEFKDEEDEDLPELSVNAIEKLNPWDSREFAEKMISASPVFTVKRLSPTDRESVTLLLSTYIEHLCREAPTEEQNFYVLLEMLNYSGNPTSMDNKDSVERLIEESVGRRIPKPAYYGEYLTYKATCKNKEHIIHICRALVSSVITLYGGDDEKAASAVGKEKA